jgi:DNA-binding response OmpR family regulator
MLGASMQRRNQTKTAYLSPGAPSAGCRVLIVEDEWFLANDLQTALKSVGADVIALVGDIDDARAQLASGGFDVGVIDIKLRGHDAFDLADELRRQGRPFVFATGYSAEVIPARFANAPRWEKPYDPHSLARYVLQLWHDGSQANSTS